MVMVSNSSPLIYLANMGEWILLERLFSEVIVADKVFEEVVVQGAGMPGSEEVRSADWIRRKSVLDRATVQKLRDEELVDAGEAETLVMAQELKAGLVLLDDRKARRLAAKMKVRKAGTIAVILAAHKRGLIEDLPAILRKAREKAFRINERVFSRLVSRGTVKLG